MQLHLICPRSLDRQQSYQIPPQILAQPNTNSPPKSIFGPEPLNSWCYFYQKAALARQLKNWEQVAEWGDRAAEQGFEPTRSASNTPLEWIPFIEGYARVGRWEEAQAISETIYQKDKRMAARLCTLWSSLEDAAQTDAGRKSVTDVLHMAVCPP